MILRCPTTANPEQILYTRWRLKDTMIKTRNRIINNTSLELGNEKYNVLQISCIDENEIGIQSKPCVIGIESNTDSSKHYLMATEYRICTYIAIIIAIIIGTKWLRTNNKLLKPWITYRRTRLHRRTSSERNDHHGDSNEDITINRSETIGEMERLEREIGNIVHNLTNQLQILSNDNRTPTSTRPTSQTIT